MTEEEFNETVASNFGSLFRTAEAVLGCEEAAKDAVQQTLIRVWKNIGSFDPKKGTLEALLQVAVKRQAVDHKVSRARRLAAMERFWGEIIPERPKKADPRIEGLMDALGDLRADKRALIQKYYIEGKSVAVIANEMWMTQSATKAKIHRVRGSLLHKRRADWEDQRSADFVALKRY